MMCNQLETCWSSPVDMFRPMTFCLPGVIRSLHTPRHCLRLLGHVAQIDQAILLGTCTAWLPAWRGSAHERVPSSEGGYTILHEHALLQEVHIGLAVQIDYERLALDENQLRAAVRQYPTVFFLAMDMDRYG